MTVIINHARPCLALLIEPTTSNNSVELQLDGELIRRQGNAERESAGDGGGIEDRSRGLTYFPNWPGPLQRCRSSHDTNGDGSTPDLRETQRELGRGGKKRRRGGDGMFRICVELGGVVVRPAMAAVAARFFSAHRILFLATCA